LKGIAFTAALALWALAPATFAQEPPAQQSHAEEEVSGPDDLPSVPVGDEADEPLPGLPMFEWGLTSNVQEDVLLNSDLEEERQRSSLLRRARVSLTLEYAFDWVLKAGGDFADGAELRELSIEYRGWPVFIEAGRLVEPFGVLQGGSRNAPLMERPQAYGLATGYGLGLALNTRGERWGFTIGGYKATKNSPIEEGGREEDAVTLRLSFVPVKGEDKLLHLGFAGSWRQAKDGSTLQFVAIPETVLLLGLNADSPIFFADPDSPNRYYLYGIEFASQLGPVVLKSEYMQAHIDDVAAFDPNTGDVSQGDAVYFSYYFEAAWALTGERRDYSVRRGVLGGINPAGRIVDGGIGAFEMAIRNSFIHLNDGSLGGEEGHVLSLGLNWYPLDEVKVMVEALEIEEARVFSSESASAVQARIQANFGL
jgi:phosphate-selective porin OprO/OprP